MRVRKGKVDRLLGVVRREKVNPTDKRNEARSKSMSFVQRHTFIYLVLDSLEKKDM